MTLEECIKGYVDLSNQVVAYHCSTNGNTGWHGLFDPALSDSGMTAYIAANDRETTSAKVGRSYVHHNTNSIVLPIDGDNFQRVKDDLVALQRKMLSGVLMAALEKEDADA